MLATLTLNKLQQSFLLFQWFQWVPGIPGDLRLISCLKSYIMAYIEKAHVLLSNSLCAKE